MISSVSGRPSISLPIATSSTSSFTTISKDTYIVILSNLSSADRANLLLVNRVCRQDTCNNMVKEKEQILTYITGINRNLDVSKYAKEISEINTLYSEERTLHSQLSISSFSYPERMNLIRQKIFKILDLNTPEKFSQLTDNREIMLLVVSCDGYKIQDMPESLKHDAQIVLTAVKQYGFSFQYAAAHFRADLKFIKAAVHRCPTAFHYVVMPDKTSIKYTVLKELALETMAKNATAYFTLPSLLQSDPDIVKINTRLNAFLYKI